MGRHPIQFGDGSQDGGGILSVAARKSADLDRGGHFCPQLRDRFRRRPCQRIFIKPGLLLFGSIAAFALLLRPAGLVVSIFAIILISSFASRDLRFKEALVSAIVLCIASIVVFVYALNLQIPVWPAFIVR